MKNVLSLFDWIGCWYLALKHANIDVKRYVAIEIDKYPRIVADSNLNDIIRPENDVHNYHINWEHFDLLIWWPSCQSLSVSWDGSWFEWKSGVFFEYVRILKEAQKINPNIHFLLENVKMKKEWEDIITEKLWVEPYYFNSSLVSWQNRKRLYWTNIKWINTPVNKNLTLSDIIENINYNDERYIPLPSKYQTKEILFKLNQLFETKNIIITQIRRCSYLRINDDQLRSPTLTANMWTWWYNMPIFIIQDPNNKWNYLMRKITPTECEKLQNIPKDYTKALSNSQRYKTIWNAWTVDIIAHILSFLK